MSRVIKLFGLLFVMFACTFFIDKDVVKADGCTCYYKTTYNHIEYASGSHDEMVYLVSFNYGPNNADVVKSCSASHSYSGAMTGTDQRTINTCTDYGANLSRGNPFEVDSKGISQNNCSVEACQSANLKYCFEDNENKSKDTIITSVDNCNKNSSFTAISQSEFDGLYNSKDTVGDESGENNKLSGEELSKIKKWGESEKYDLSDLGNDCDVISGDIRGFLNNLLWIISIIGIILLVVMTAFEFVKVVTGQDDEGIKKAFKHTIIRIVCVVILLLLPMIVSSVITIINKNAGGTVQIGDNGSPTCQVGE